MLIELFNASFGYRRVPVVHVEALRVERGRCLGIFGPNGAGKTTLVRGMTGMLSPLVGEVRREPNVKIGYVAQHRAMELHWPMTGLDVAAMAISARQPLGWTRPSRPEIRQALRELGVDHLANRPFASMSGGQQQRFIVAGALADDPNVLVFDEPTDGLDVASRDSFLATVRARIAAGLCVVMISHEVDDLLEIADEIAWLHPGAEAGKPSHIELITPEQLSNRLTRHRKVDTGSIAPTRY